MAYNYDPSDIRAGGGITYVHSLIKNLLVHGIEITLFGKKLSPKQDFQHPNFEFIPVMFGVGNWWKFLIKLRYAVNNHKLTDVDIIHTHNPLTMYTFIKSYPNTPKVCTLHGMPLDWVKINYSYANPLIRPTYKYFESKIINNVNKIATAGPYTKMRLLKRYPNLDLADKVISIPSGVNVDKFKPIDKEEMRKELGLDKFSEIIIYVGRIAEIKNINLLLKSFLLTKKLLKNSALIIVGRGEKENDVKDFSKRLDLENVIFTGELSSDKVVKLMNCSDILTLTSWFEASPTVIRESLSCGVPVVTTNVGDVNTIISNKYLGEIVNSYDEVDFSEAMIKLINLVKDRPREVQYKCRELALSEFSFDNTVSKYIDLYNELTTKKA